MTFHKVFDQKYSQEDIFDIVAKPVVSSVLQGFNGTIFAYGQTGSGKTYSITGSSKDYNDRGIIPRSIQYVFAQNEKVTIKPTVYISYMEIYNEIGYDLLNSRHDNTARSLEELPRIVLLEDSNGEVHMRNLSVLPVSTEQEAMRLLFLGDTNRIIAETPMNEYSSRSHCIFTIYIAFRDEPSNILRFSKLHLVDLAGSERVCKSMSTGTALKEAKHINLSLHYLQQVILALSESKRLHVPYRNSMMTYILKDSLSGNCFTAMLATLALTKDNIQETISTCRFAQRVSMISTAPVINEMRDPQKEITFLKTTIEELRREISLLNHLSTGSVLDKNQEEQCKNDVEKYLASSCDKLNVEPSMTYIQYCFKLLKNRINSQNSEKKEKQLEYVQSQKTLSALKNTIDKKDEEINTLKKLVDDLKDTPSRVVSKKNILATHETETNNIVVNYLLDKQDQYTKGKRQYNKNLSESNMYDSRSEQDIEKQLFENFLKDPENGKDMEYYTQNLQKKLEIAKIYAETIDQCQKNITYIRQQLQSRTNNTVKNKLIIELEEQQKIYSKSLDDLKMVKNETYHLQSGLKKAELKTMRIFKGWLERQQGLKLSKSLDSTCSRDSDYSTNNSNCYLCRSTQNMSRKVSSKDCACNVEEKKYVSVGCCNSVHAQQPANYWTDCWSENVCIGPVCQPLVDQDQYCIHSANCHRESIRKSHSNVFNNVRKSGVLHHSELLCDPETVLQFEKIAPLTKVCESCSVISHNKNWRSLTSMREKESKTFCCRVINSEHQPGERYFRRNVSGGETYEQKSCCECNNDPTFKSLPNPTEYEYNNNPALQSFPSIPECNTCPFPSIDDDPDEEESQNDEAAAENEVGEGKYEENSKNSDLIKETDSMQFKEFMKTVPLTGDTEIDTEIFNFYRTKFCQ
ncbi:kinesin-like protein KIF6 [Anoplophora glabripennis]|uniref:kinesin-like protein KIF6 n=1 Tax=Anoplophora glabripennis TaxID=217634 RepID=UPI0008745BFA|nr:kinesin-like protein KIF6 [Anoplophora glabripennis]